MRAFAGLRVPEVAGQVGVDYLLAYRHDLVTANTLLPLLRAAIAAGHHPLGATALLATLEGTIDTGRGAEPLVIVYAGEGGAAVRAHAHFKHPGALVALVSRLLQQLAPGSWNPVTNSRVLFTTPPGNMRGTQDRLILEALCAWALNSQATVSDAVCPPSRRQFPMIGRNGISAGNFGNPSVMAARLLAGMGDCSLGELLGLGWTHVAAAWLTNRLLMLKVGLPDAVKALSLKQAYSMSCAASSAETTVALLDGVHDVAGAAFVAALAALVPALLPGTHFTVSATGRLAFRSSLGAQCAAVHALAMQHKITTGVNQGIGGAIAGAIGGANDPLVATAQAALTAAQLSGDLADIAATTAVLQTAQDKQMLVHNKKVAGQSGPMRRARAELEGTASQAEVQAHVASSRAASAAAVAAWIVSAPSYAIAHGCSKPGTGVVGTPSLRRLAHTHVPMSIFFPFLFVLQFPRKRCSAHIARWIMASVHWPPT